MIIFERLGGWGLGNSLFQIATTIGIATDNESEYRFPSNCNFRISRYLNNSQFKRELPWIDVNRLNNLPRWGIGDSKYVQPPKFDSDVVIDGFFQSEKYFKSHRDDVLKMFELADIIKEEISSKYSMLFNTAHCGLHVRRGDYFTAKEMRVIDVTYYKEAIKSFDSNTTFVIFSDDINWCKNNLDFIPKKIFIEERNDLKEMYLMSRLSGMIIANSTFSWWGAWLGNQSKVVIPNPNTNWFSDLYYNERGKMSNFNDLVCEGWLVI